MGDLFTKTFFKFLFGFVAIIALSFVILTIADNYDENNKQNNTATLE